MSLAMKTKNIKKLNSNKVIVSSLNQIKHLSRQQRICQPRAFAAIGFLLLMAFSGSLFAQTLIGHWTFANQTLANTGTTGATNDGAYYVQGTASAPVFSTNVPPGMSGYSLDLTAAGAFMAVSNSGSSDSQYNGAFDNGSFTVALWEKRPNSAWQYDAWNVFADKTDGGSVGFFLRRQGGGNNPFADVYPTDPEISSSQNINDGSWHHLAITFSGGVLTLYVDGVAAGSGSGTFTPDTAAKLIFGAQDNTGFRSSGALLSDLRFYNSALSARQVNQLVYPPDSITLANPSFEQGYNNTGVHYGTPPGWASSSPTAGINDSTGPFWDNGGSVDQTYVGLVQNNGLLGQTLTDFQVGQTYWIQFFANARNDVDTPDVAVFEAASTQGGAAIVSGINIKPVGGPAGSGNPFVFINVPFVAAMNTGDLNIQKTCHNPTNNVSPYDGSATLLLDGFSVIRRSPNDVVIANPSFEASGTGQASPGYVSAIAGWTLSATNQIAINQSAGSFTDNGTIPDGNNVLGITSGSAVSQIISSLVPGKPYQLSLYVNSSSSSATPTAVIKIGDQTAYNATVTPVGGGNPYQFVTYSFTADSTNALLIISNATATATSSCLLVDNVRLIKQMYSINLQNPSFEQGYNTNWPHYGAIPGWASSVGNWGINDATGPFWDNGGTVDSTYVGFIQGDGLLGQPTSGFQVGQTYWIQFYANARAADGGGTNIPTVAVYDAASTAGGAAIVSGITVPPVGGAAGSGNPFQFINVPFTAAATSGDLNLVKSSPNGSDTLLVDGFSIICRTTNDIVIQNPSFEASGTGQTFPGTVNAIAGWTLSGPGPNIINQTGGAYLDGGEVVPDGNNCLVIQNVSAFSQVLHGLTVGKWYRLTLLANSRHYGAATALITIDGKTAYNALVPTLGSQPWQVISYDFQADATDVTLSIGNTDASNSYFVDDVRVYAPTPVAPGIVTQPTPTNATRYAGLSFTLTGAVSGFPVPTLQWQHNGSNISGATNATLTLPSLQATDAGSYVLTATNSAGSTNSSAVSLTVMPATSAYASAVIAQDPMGYWRFSDGGGTNAYDYAGGNNAYDTNYVANSINGGTGGPASLGAGPQPSVFPGFETTNTAPFLDGFSQGYSSSVGLFNNRSNFTIMGWFYIDPSKYPFMDDGYGYIHPAGRASLFGQQWAAELGFYQGTNLYFYATGISATIFANTNVTPGVWNFVAAVSDATANTTTLYLNGAAVGTASSCPGTVNPYVFSIGKDVSYSPAGGYDKAFFPGSLDEVAAFDHPLTAATVQALYQTAVTVNSASPTNVMAKVVNIGGTNNLILTGAGGSGSSYTVLTATNLTVPLANWATNATGLPFGPNGSVNYTNPINPAKPQLYYRIRVP